MSFASVAMFGPQRQRSDRTSALPPLEKNTNEISYRRELTLDHVRFRTFDSLSRIATRPHRSLVFVDPQSLGNYSALHFDTI